MNKLKSAMLVVMMVCACYISYSQTLTTYNPVDPSNETPISQQGATKNLVIEVSPNPTSGKITISGRNLVEGHVNLWMFQATGNTLYSRSFSGVGQNFKKNLNLESLSPGVYYLMVRADGQRDVIKIFKQ